MIEAANSRSVTWKGPDRARVARDWWRRLQPRRSDSTGVPGAGGDRGDPAALARLRRASTVAQAMAEEATLDLFRRLGLTRADADTARLPRVAVIAMVLAHVRDDREHDGERRRSAIQAVGRRTLEDTDSAKMSPLRFRRLLACRDDDDEDLAREMRRLVQLAGCAVNVGDLAESLFYWNERTRNRWAFDYFGAGFAAPDHELQAPKTMTDAD
ncbi:MAG: type I-E CRISPR-associated protein Cse2/CasB [Rhodospirillales bacterium]|nr:MAG: type I-E CRISPR-associated protein Cse2/CasB [Rhodospirillales bacterium]